MNWHASQLPTDQSSELQQGLYWHDPSPTTLSWRDAFDPSLIAVMPMFQAPWKRTLAMTSPATALGVLPLPSGRGEPGRELEGPMAMVILGGLISSSALNLLVLPALASRLGRFDMHTGASSAASP